MSYKDGKDCIDMKVKSGLSLKLMPSEGLPLGYPFYTRRKSEHQGFLTRAAAEAYTTPGSSQMASLCPYGQECHHTNFEGFITAIIIADDRILEYPRLTPHAKPEYRYIKLNPSAL